MVSAPWAIADQVRLSRDCVGLVAGATLRLRIALRGRFRIDPTNERKAGVESDPLQTLEPADPQ